MNSNCRLHFTESRGEFMRIALTVLLLIFPIFSTVFIKSAWKLFWWPKHGIHWSMWINHLMRGNSLLFPHSPQRTTWKNHFLFYCDFTKWWSCMESFKFDTSPIEKFNSTRSILISQKKFWNCHAKSNIMIFINNSSRVIKVRLFYTKFQSSDGKMSKFTH